MARYSWEWGRVALLPESKRHRKADAARRRKPGF
jgi:hypothetical protein